MVLISFTRLLPHPVHEETIGQMNHSDSSQHDDCQTRRREPSQEPQQQGDASKGFSDDHEKCDEPWDVHGLRKKPQCPSESESTIPAEELLRSVWEHYEPKCEP